MNRRETAQEPSMEDILASIRKIIAEDPPASPPVQPFPRPAPSDPFTAVPVQRPKTEPAPRAGAAPPAGQQGSLSARLNDVFGPGVVAEPAPSNNSRPISRRTSMDDDLGDILADGPASRPPVATPTAAPSRPEPVVIAQAPTQTPARPLPSSFSTSPETLTGPGASRLDNGTQARMAPGRSEPSLMLPSFAQAPVPAVKPAPVVIAAMPQRPVHVSPPVAPDPGPAIASQAPVPVVKAEPALFAQEAPTESARRFPQASGASEPIAPAGTEPAVVAANAPVRSDESVAVAAAPLEEPLRAAAPAPLEAAAPPQPAVKPVTPAPAMMANTEPQLATIQPAIALDPSADAVASALGALAAGLAASARPANPEIVVSAVEVTQPSAGQTAAVPGTALQSSGAVSVFSSPDTFVGGAALTPIETRTLDDTAAELLRPMLRQWLDANMPRIVEKALRIELANPTVGRPPYEPDA